MKNFLFPINYRTPINELLHFIYFHIDIFFLKSLLNFAIYQILSFQPHGMQLVARNMTLVFF